MSNSTDVDRKIVYEETGRNYRAFLDWREKIVGGYVTIVGVLGLGFYRVEAKGDVRFILLFAAIVVSLVFRVLNIRNSEFIRKCVEAGKALEPQGGVYTSLETLTSTFLTHGLAFGLLQSTVVGVSAIGMLQNWPWWLQRGGSCRSITYVLLLCGAIILLNFNHLKRIR